MEDKYLISKINNSQFINESDNMFKSSHTMAQLAVDMDQEGPENSLQGEEAYSSGLHLHCIGYKTLALFVYHPTMQCIFRLATMEVKSEATHEISFFWKLFNEDLHHITETDYKFNLKQ